ncbi:MAG: FAD-dependent oxidoreductase [SAR324 cluster bacterium]|nr:FAD-dependent oxidoreductase [SAR324 cluster bacterium]
MATKRHVIVGAGTAGLNAIRTLRQAGDKGEIALVSAEAPYSRMVLPYYLDQSITEAHTATVSPATLDKWGVTRYFGRRAVALNTKANKLRLDDDQELEYDNLLIATGSSAARPRIKGADDPSLYTFWTLDDAKGVNQTIGPQTHTVVVGAGFIAFTILNGLIGRSKNLTIVESESRILPRMVDGTGAKIMEDWLKARGVKIRTGARLTAIEKKGAQHLLKFKSGPSISADLVVMATGIHTNLGWLKGSGVKTKAAVLVDDQMRSNIPNVFAAGDVAEGKNLITGVKEVHAIEPTAMEHGRVAGANMAGKKVGYPGSLLINMVGVAGLDLASFGDWDAKKADVITGLAPERSAYRKYLFKGDRMIGAIMAGPSQETWSDNDLGMVKGLVQTGARLGGWKKFLAAHPFGIKKPYLATRTVSSLLPKTVLGQPSLPPQV